MFARGKSFPHSTGYTIGKLAPIFPHVENSVENVQKSSFHAYFPGGIPQFPPSFQQCRFDRQRSVRTFCKIQVGKLTVFSGGNTGILPESPTSKCRMWIRVENGLRISLILSCNWGILTLGSLKDAQSCIQNGFFAPK